MDTRFDAQIDQKILDAIYACCHSFIDCSPPNGWFSATLEKKKSQITQAKKELMQARKDMLPCAFRGVGIIVPYLKFRWFWNNFLVSSISSKKRKKEFDFNTMIPKVVLFSFLFWRRSKVPKNLTFRVRSDIMPSTAVWTLEIPQNLTCPESRLFLAQFNPTKKDYWSKERTHARS